MLENLDDNSPYWVAVSRLLLILQSQLKEAKEDLLAATVQNPLYGVMQSVRAALEEAKEMYKWPCVLKNMRLIVDCINRKQSGHACRCMCIVDENQLLTCRNEPCDLVVQMV